MHVLSLLSEISEQLQCWCFFLFEFKQKEKNSHNQRSMKIEVLNINKPKMITSTSSGYQQFISTWTHGFTASSSYTSGRARIFKCISRCVVVKEVHSTLS